MAKREVKRPRLEETCGGFEKRGPGMGWDVAFDARLLQFTSDLLTVHDREGTVLFANATAERVLGVPAEELLGTNLVHLIHPDDREAFAHQLQKALGHDDERTTLRARVLHRDCRYRDVELVVHNTLDDPELGGVVVSTSLRDREQHPGDVAFKKAMLDSLPALTAVLDRSGNIVTVNSVWTAYMQRHGGTPETCGVGVSFLDVCERAGTSEALQVATAARAMLDGELPSFEHDIETSLEGLPAMHFSLQMTPLHTSEGGIVVGYTDISERKSLEIEAAHRATHDILTGLPNRTLLRERLEHALLRRAPHGTALLFLDLDGFKLVNDSYGHDTGDAVLVELARRLQLHVRPSDTVARLAGDEFVVLCEDVRAESETHQLAERLILAVAEPFTFGQATLQLGVSIGIAVASDHSLTPNALLSAADQAMFEAKHQGRNRFEVWTPSLRPRRHERLEQATALRRLLDNHGLRVHYQSVIDLRDGHLLGAEALLRWTGEEPLPDTTAAIALAEELGLIERIGEFVLREATAAAAGFVGPGGTVLPLAVNVAPQQLKPSLVAQVQRAAAAAGYPLHSLTLELTERSLSGATEGDTRVLQTLRELGVRIAWDHFGSGSTSFAAVRELPLDVLKLDWSIVRGLLRSQFDPRFTSAIISLAAALGLEIVAEGIESADQRDRLLELGCTRGQGFLYSPAEPAEVMRQHALLGR